MSPIPDTELPEAVKASVFQDIATSQNIPVESLQVVGARRESWPDGCLGLGGPDEICTFAIVEGWEVTVSRDNDIWVYSHRQRWSQYPIGRCPSNRVFLTKCLKNGSKK